MDVSCALTNQPTLNLKGILSMLEFIIETITYVIKTISNNFLVLLIGILIASTISVHLNAEKIRNYLLKRSKVSVPGAVAFGAFTPFCACGTMAVIVSLLAATIPWGATMAFLTASPIMSPDLFIMMSGVVSLNFAVALAISAVTIGALSGYLSQIIEKNTNYLNNQIRYKKNTVKKGCGCSEKNVKEKTNNKCNSKEQKNTQTTCGCSDENLKKSSDSCCDSKRSNEKSKEFWQKLKIREVLKTVINLGIKRVLFFFSIFAAISYIINSFVPQEIIFNLFNSSNLFAVPIASIIGMPLYVSGSSSLPLINSLMESGASQVHF
ncbi:permease [Herbivorax sp. ANBcel31]|uniref:permease n=1 Tax=Herbivorax sp. ANBcel31 TaxID=3069754 RepID=UPI0027B6E264|nr:permease [Herbivorax sp. ANBcel31]MDQ2086763.1 permease [Herbivorax sp. ANBcel31]